jgi:cation:H+ antiporter
MTLSGSDLVAVVGAVVLAAVGGELFLKGVLGVAASLRIPKLLVATTLAAFATSSPELTVSTVAALSGQPEIGLGDALGSNVVNIALIFGLALLFGPLRIERRELGRDFALGLAVPLLTLLFVLDGILSRGEGGMLLLVFALWLGLLIRAGRAARAPATTEPDAHPWRSLLLGAAGLAALVLAGRLFVTGAPGVATAFGIDAYVIGATVVAVGTSLPELVTVLLSRLRGHDEVGVGTLLGSNLFNGLAIVGVAASIHPIAAPPAEVAVALGMGLLSLLLLVPGRDTTLGRGRGLLLLSVYVLFVAMSLVGAASRRSA